MRDVSTSGYCSQTPEMRGILAEPSNFLGNSCCHRSLLRLPPLKKVYVLVSTKGNVNGLILVDTNMNVQLVLELILQFAVSKNHLRLLHPILGIIFVLAITLVQLTAMLPFLQIWPKPPDSRFKFYRRFSIGRIYW